MSATARAIAARTTDALGGIRVAVSDPSVIVLPKRSRWAAVFLELAVLASVAFFLFAVTHRYRAHSAGKAECCTATAQGR